MRRLAGVMAAMCVLALVNLPGPARAATPAGTVVFLKGWVTGDTWRYQLWSSRPDGSAAHALTTDPDLLPYAAANRQGTKVAFTVGHGSRLSSAGLYVIAIDGSGRRNLLRGRHSLYDVAAPSWSSDGKRLVFVGMDTDFR